MALVGKGVVAAEGTSYPCLRISLTSGKVVLFSDANTGTVVVEGNNEDSDKLGFHTDGWRNSDDSSVWGKCNSVTIEEKL